MLIAGGGAYTDPDTGGVFVFTITGLPSKLAWDVGSASICTRISIVYYISEII